MMSRMTNINQSTAVANRFADNLPKEIMNYLIIKQDQESLTTIILSYEVKLIGWLG